MAGSDDFKKFDTVSDGGAVTDNHFYHSPTAPSHTLQKKIMKEWRILKKDLPDSIFVRAYENHIDFLRAAIVGAAGTPYHDCLFFFDLHFPSDYPASPPNVHFRSHGLRLNPNLYASGEVCLSLLNTWSGAQSERWNPNESTVLQVLLSIQALVLNAEPYFNEPGIGYLGDEKRSRVYTENAFVLSCKTTSYLLRRSPRCFEQLVVGHFRRRAGAVLGACRAYAEGRVRVGEYNGGGGETTALEKVDVSLQFQRSVAVVYKKLVKEFERRGISVEGAPRVLEIETASFGGEDGDDRIRKRFAFALVILVWIVILFCFCFFLLFKAGRLS